MDVRQPFEQALPSYVLIHARIGSRVVLNAAMQALRSGDCVNGVKVSDERYDFVMREITGQA